MSKALAKVAEIRAAAQLTPNEWSDERIMAVVKMSAPAAPNLHVAAMFLAAAAKYDLDPLLGEIWLGELNGKPTVITGRNSYIKAAQRDPGYLGFDSGVVREKDEFEIRRKGESVEVHHTIRGFGARGKIVGAYCVAYHKDRRPVAITRAWEDFRHLHSRPTWRQNPEDMIETRAIVAALRRQFNLGGLYTEADGAHQGGADAGAIGEVTTDPLTARLRSEQAESASEPVAEAEAAGQEIQDAEWEVVEGEEDEAQEAPKFADDYDDEDEAVAAERDELIDDLFGGEG